MADFAVQMEKILDDYKKDVADATEAAINRTARDTVQKLKNTSPRGYTGEYAAGWTVKKDGRLTQTVHNKKYQLTHLLNNGHVVRNKYGTYGRVEGDNHITDAANEAETELVQEIERRLQ